MREGELACERSIEPQTFARSFVRSVHLSSLLSRPTKDIWKRGREIHCHLNWISFSHSRPPSLAFPQSIRQAETLTARSHETVTYVYTTRRRSNRFSVDWLSTRLIRRLLSERLTFSAARAIIIAQTAKSREINRVGYIHDRRYIGTHRARGFTRGEKTVSSRRKFHLYSLKVSCSSIRWCFSYDVADASHVCYPYIY